jgi:hypothetical protein
MIRGFFVLTAATLLGQPGGGRIPSRVSVQFNELTTVSTSTTGATSYATASVTGRRDSLQLLAVVNSKASAPDTPTASGGGLTWVQIATKTYNTTGSPTQRITLFRALGSPTAGAITADFAGATQTGCSLYICQFHNVDTSGTNGSGAIVQNATNSAETSTSGSVTLAAVDSTTRNAGYVVWGGSLNSSTVMTAEGGWAEVADAGYNTPTTWIGVQIATPAFSDNTPTATFTSQNWGGIAIEIKATP